MPEVKRLNYFNGQFLKEQDFRDEQKYHIDMRTRHNRDLHTWGVADGFQVEQQGPAHILVRPGFAIDRHGREIILPQPENRDVTAFGRDNRVFVSVKVIDRRDPEDHVTGPAYDDYVRITEAAELVLRKQEPDEEDLVPLAVVTIDAGGRIESIDHSIRRTAGPFVPSGSIRTEHLADGCITPSKLSRDMELVSGWVRVCFKPHPEKGKAAYDVGPTEAVSGKEQTVGSIGITSPPGAKRVLEFIVAGIESGDGVAAVLWRCGWNEELAEHDKKELLRLEHKGEGKKAFLLQDHVKNGDLDTRYHALAVSIQSAMARISLVAVRFEYELDA